MENTIIYKLPEIIDKEAIYYKILSDLTNRYRGLKSGEFTAVSLALVERINANAIPLLMGMLNLLQNKSDNPVYLELAYNPRLLAFLDSIGFFCELSQYGIIKYDKKYIVGLSDYRYSKDNKILPHEPIKDYEDKTKQEKQEIRDALAEKMRGELSHSLLFKEVVKNDELWDTMIVAFTELIVNAIIHSGSLSYTYMQSRIAFGKNKRGYLLSVVDVGRGFYASLSKKIEKDEGYTQEDRDFFYQYARSLGINVSEELNFLSIMEALYYSEIKTRDMDLFKLKNLLAISNANFRVHHKNTEVVFTCDKCSKCIKKDILRCVKCIWQGKHTKTPSIRTYPVVMAGVHIEVEFIQEWQNV